MGPAKQKVEKLIEELIGKEKSFKKLRNSMIERIDIIISFVTGLIVSPFLAICSDWLKKKIFYPKITPISSRSTAQKDLIVTRLLFKNEGSVGARDVEVYVEKIFDGDEERENFVPVPLGWTHVWVKKESSIARDIHPNQNCYLDICNLFPIQGRYQLRLALQAGLQYENLSRLRNGKTKLILVIYNESGRSVKLELFLKWDGTSSPPKLKFKKLN